MVAHVAGGSSPNGAFLSTQGEPTFNSGTLSKTRAAGISGNAKITTHNGVVVRNDTTASADASASVDHETAARTDGPAGARRVPAVASATHYLTIAGNAVASH